MKVRDVLYTNITLSGLEQKPSLLRRYRKLVITAEVELSKARKVKILYVEFDCFFFGCFFEKLCTKLGDLVYQEITVKCYCSLGLGK